MREERYKVGGRHRAGLASTVELTVVQMIAPRFLREDRQTDGGRLGQTLSHTHDTVLMIKQEA